MSDAISRRLIAAAWRLRVERLAPWLVWSLLIFLIGLLLWRLLAWSHPAWPRGDLGWLLAVAGSLAVLGALASWRKTRDVARELDRRLVTHDRYVSWLGTRTEPASPAKSAFEREAAVFSESQPLTSFFRPRFPLKGFLLLLAAAAGLGLLEKFHHDRQSSLAGERAEAEHLLARAEEVIARQESTDPQLAALHDDLRKTWQKLGDSTEPKRDAFRALSDLEKKLGEAAQASALTREEQAALAQALTEKNPSAARNLAEGSGAQAVEQIAQLDPEALAQALDEAARHRESQRLRDLANQSGPQAQQVLVKAMNASSAAQKAQQGLREAKAGQDKSTSEEQNPTGGPGLAAETRPGQQSSQPGDMDQAPPGGGAGSEQDKGKGDDIRGERDQLAKSTSQDDLLPSTSGGPGPSRFSSTLLSGDGPGQARPTDPSITQAAIAAALQEVGRENIPPGSQILVRRYFESIRPRE